MTHDDRIRRQLVPGEVAAAILRACGEGFWHRMHDNDPVHTPPARDADGRSPLPGQIICCRCELVAEPFDVSERGRPICRECSDDEEARIDLYG